MASAICAGICIWLAHLVPAQAQEREGWVQRNLIDPDDGKFDVSHFLAEAHGFLPIGTIITDPAVGYGAGLGLVFIQPGNAGAAARPNMSAVGGFATDNGSWGAFGGDVRNWRADSLKTVFGGFYASANLEFFGSDAPISEEPLEYNLLAKGALAEVRNNLGSSDAWIGLRYLVADVTTAFDLGNVVPGIAPIEYDQKISGLTPILSYDSRDNIFTPTKGIYGEASVAVFDDALGSDSDFQIVTLTGLWFRPLTRTLYLGTKADLAASFDDTPFYLRPFAQLRGLQSMRLQGENMADLEMELRWQSSPRWSWVAFAGAAAAWQGLTDFERARDAVTGGIGVRYLAARKFGLNMGFDLAVGPDDPIIYFQFGSAWFRP